MYTTLYQITCNTLTGKNIYNYVGTKENCLNVINELCDAANVDVLENKKDSVIYSLEYNGEIYFIYFDDSAAMQENENEIKLFSSDNVFIFDNYTELNNYLTYQEQSILSAVFIDYHNNHKERKFKTAENIYNIIPF